MKNVWSALHWYWFNAFIIYDCFILLVFAFKEICIDYHNEIANIAINKLDDSYILSKSFLGARYSEHNSCVIKKTFFCLFFGGAQFTLFGWNSSVSLVTGPSTLMDIICVILLAEAESFLNHEYKNKKMKVKLMYYLFYNIFFGNFFFFH